MVVITCLGTQVQAYRKEVLMTLFLFAQYLTNRLLSKSQGVAGVCLCQSTGAGQRDLG